MNEQAGLDTKKSSNIRKPQQLQQNLDIYKLTDNLLGSKSSPYLRHPASTSWFPFSCTTLLNILTGQPKSPKISTKNQQQLSLNVCSIFFFPGIYFNKLEITQIFWNCVVFFSGIFQPFWIQLEFNFYSGSYFGNRFFFNWIDLENRYTVLWQIIS